MPEVGIQTDGGNGGARRRSVLDVMEIGDGFGSFGIGPEVTTQADMLSDKMDLFSTTPVEGYMEHFRESRIYPIAGQNNLGPWGFHVPAMASLFLDASSMRLEGEVSIWERKSDGTEAMLTQDTNIIPINMLPVALFNNVEVSFNGLMVSFVSSPISNYKAYLETILSYNELSARTHLAGSRFKIDDVGKFGATTTSAKTNQEARLKWFAKSNAADFSIPLASDILRMDRYLMDRIALDIKLSRTNDQFLITQDKDDAKNYFVKVDKLVLVVRHIGLKQSYVEHVNKQLDSGKRARYPLVRTVLKSRVIATGESYTPIVDIFSGRMPSSIYFGFVKNSAFKGHKNENAFNFQSFDIGGVSLLVNSKCFPAQRYTPSFTDDVSTSKIMREYMGLMNNIGIQGGNESPLVTLERFHEGCTIFGFDLRFVYYMILIIHYIF